MNFLNQVRRTLNTLLLGGLLLLAMPLAAQAQGDFPSRLVTIVLPYPPGGLADAASRRLAQRLSEVWKVSVVVDSKPCAAGLLGAGIVAKAPGGRLHPALYDPGNTVDHQGSADPAGL